MLFKGHYLRFINYNSQVKKRSFFAFRNAAKTQNVNIGNLKCSLRLCDIKQACYQKEIGLIKIHQT